MPVTFFIAFLGGLIPAALWLFFWLQEDRCEPEPKLYIFLTFVGGMIAVALALPIEQYVQQFLTGISLYIGWATVEEVLKFGAAYYAALRWSVFDEPLDAVIYMVTAALGFSMVENALFLVPSIAQGDYIRTLATGDLRFIGATLLHILSSATIGIALAFAFSRSPSARKLAALGGLILAVMLHTLFNFFILKEGSGGTFFIFFCIWIGIIALLLIIERIKIPKKDYC